MKPALDKGFATVRPMWRNCLKLHMKVSTWLFLPAFTAQHVQQACQMASALFLAHNRFAAFAP